MNPLPNATEEKITIGDRPTPITDAAESTCREAKGCVNLVFVDDMADLERQLADAREEIQRVRCDLEKMGRLAHSNACESLDHLRQMRKHAAEAHEAIEAHEFALRERDEMRESIADLSHPNCKMLLRERDEAREELAEERALADKLAYSVQPFANYACNSDRPCRCHNCAARLTLTEWKEARKS